jgi:hypothetical protein
MVMKRMSCHFGILGGDDVIERSAQVRQEEGEGREGTTVAETERSQRIEKML